jgi:hypothetical protein
MRVCDTYNGRILVNKGLSLLGRCEHIFCTIYRGCWCGQHAMLDISYKQQALTKKIVQNEKITQY